MCFGSVFKLTTKPDNNIICRYNHIPFSPESPHIRYVYERCFYLSYSFCCSFSLLIRSYKLLVLVYDIQPICQVKNFLYNIVIFFNVVKNYLFVNSGHIDSLFTPKQFILYTRNHGISVNGMEWYTHFILKLFMFYL